MKDQIIAEIERSMLLHLDNAQMEQLHFVLTSTLWNVSLLPVEKEQQVKHDPDNVELVSMFLSSKKLKDAAIKL